MSACSSQFFLICGFYRGGQRLSIMAAYLITRFLMRYFETGRLHPFAYCCWGIGGISLILFLLGIGTH
jgi:undecaprenyl-diphosphatase